MSRLHSVWYWIGRIPAIIFDLPIDWPPPCRCDACTGRARPVSRNPNVSNGLHVRVGKDGNIHFRSKSRFTP